LWRDKQLQYSWLGAVRAVTPIFFTGDRRCARIADPSLRERLMQLYLTLDANPGAPAVLRQLRDAGFATAILSNGSPAMLTAAVDHAGLGAMFESRAIH
jgi:2-haloacid dehalogenase